MQLITNLIKKDKLRLQALESVRQLDLPQCYIAAGFLRNLVWDHLHHYPEATKLNDVDVIYFDNNESDPNYYLQAEHYLQEKMPALNWQVRNQAYMHQRNGDKPYTSSLDAMGFWPEKETAIAIRLTAMDTLDCIAAFGFGSLFKLELTPNPKRSYLLFEQRVKCKNWLIQWPKLSIVNYRTKAQ